MSGADGRAAWPGIGAGPPDAAMTAPAVYDTNPRLAYADTEDGRIYQKGAQIRGLGSR